MKFRSQDSRQMFDVPASVSLGVSVLIAFLVLIGCDSRQTVESDASAEQSSVENSTHLDSENNMSAEPTDRGNKTPQGKSKFENAAKLEPLAKAKEFLNDHGSGTLVRIPVTIEAGPLGVGKCILGVETEASGQVEIDLDDSALGISLADRIRSYPSPGGWTPAMVTGFWNKRTIPDLSITETDEIPFMVRDVEPLNVSDASNQGLFVEVAK